MNKYTIRALYILNNKGQEFREVWREGQFIFSDIAASVEFLAFLDTYLVKNGKS